MKNKLLIAITFLGIVFASSCAKETPVTSSQLSANSQDDYTPETLPPVQRKVSEHIDKNIGGYLEALPHDYKLNPLRNYPLIIFLHGLAELGNGTSDLYKVADAAIPKLIADKTFPPDFVIGNNRHYSFIVISPQFKAWPQTSDINKMIDYAIKKYRIDSSRIYICGISMGGGAAWDYTYTSGKRIAALVPIAGASYPTPEKGQVIANDSLPVWAFQNNNDPIVPAWYSIDFIEYINDYNPARIAKLTLWPTGGHDAWTKATDPNYKENDKNIYEWMLSHKRTF